MRLAHKAERMLELPEGSLTGEARIEIDGREQLTVTGSCEIKEYEDTLVRLTTRSGEIRVCGRSLMLDNLHSRGISVVGQLLSVEFL